MKSNFPTGDVKGQKLVHWTRNAAETMNQAYRRQMEMSAQFYSRIFNISFENKNLAAGGNSWGMHIWKNHMDMAKHNMDIYTGWVNQMAELSTGSFSIDKKRNSSLTDTVNEKFILNYERQIQEIKSFNNYFLDTLEYNPGIPLSNSSLVIKNFRKSTEDCLNLFMNTVRVVLQPYNKSTQIEITSQIDAITKLNSEIWKELRSGVPCAVVEANLNN